MVPTGLLKKNLESRGDCFSWRDNKYLLALHKMAPGFVKAEGDATTWGICLTVQFFQRLLQDSRSPAVLPETFEDCCS